MDEFAKLTISIAVCWNMFHVHQAHLHTGWSAERKWGRRSRVNESVRENVNSERWNENCSNYEYILTMKLLANPMSGKELASKRLSVHGHKRDCHERMCLFFVCGGKILWQKYLSACKTFSTLCGMFGFGFLNDVVVTHLRHHYHAILHETFILPWKLPATVATSKIPSIISKQHRRGTHRLIGYNVDGYI